MKLFMRLIFIGTVAGFILGGLLKVIEQLTGKKVYILLLNVDYFPVLGNYQMNEMLEFLLHIIVSIILVLILYYGLGVSSICLENLAYRQAFNGESLSCTYVNKKVFLIYQKTSLYIVIITIISMLLFLTTTLSERTPDLTDLSALIYWVAAHIIYGTVVGLMITFMNNRGIR